MAWVRSGVSIAVLGFLMLLGSGPSSEAAQSTHPRQGIACATEAVGASERSRPAVKSCSAPDLPGTPPEGTVAIGWTLYPEEPPPGPDSRSVVIAVHENWCTGSRNPIPHLEPPEVRYLKRAVLITLWIHPPEGPRTCPGNPIAKLRVRLPGPLGTRQLYDGVTTPPRKVEPGENPRRLSSGDRRGGYSTSTSSTMPLKTCGGPPSRSVMKQ